MAAMKKALALKNKKPSIPIEIVSDNNKFIEFLAKFWIPILGATLGGPVGIASVTVAGGLSLIIDWRARVAKEIVDDVGARKIAEIIERDDKSRAVFHRILVNYLDEESEKKREKYRNYLKNLAINVHPEFDNHSRLVSKINDISLEELHVLDVFQTRYLDILVSAESQKETVQEKYPEGRGVEPGEIIRTGFFTFIPELELEDAFVYLSSNGLISSKPGRMDGTFYLPNEFGKVFMEFLKGR